MGAERIPVGESIKYLGRFNFEAQFAHLAPGLENVALRLSRILPNIGGPEEKIRGRAEQLKQPALRLASRNRKRELVQAGAVRRRVNGTILPNWKQWTESGPTTLTYRTTQILTGHGCFGEYLKQIGAE